MRRILAVTALLLVAIAVLYYWPATAPRDARKATTTPRATTAKPPIAEPTAANTSLSSPVDAPIRDTDFPLALQLNAPSSNIAQDLDLMRQIFETWQSNFPREGNPFGENSDITAALMGENRLGLALIPKGHRAVNARGELCDRWGTPFRFHQLSGTHMEIRSAGPDRKFATDDDAVWTPR
jgi:hypothetical protein